MPMALFTTPAALFAALIVEPFASLNESATSTFKIYYSDERAFVNLEGAGGNARCLIELAAGGGIMKRLPLRPLFL